MSLWLGIAIEIFIPEQLWLLIEPTQDWACQLSISGPNLPNELMLLKDSEKGSLCLQLCTHWQRNLHGFPKQFG